MYYNGYNGYNGYNMYQGYPQQYYQGGNYGFGPAMILVLFILLVIIFGTNFWSNTNNCNQCNSCNSCRN